MSKLWLNNDLTDRLAIATKERNRSSWHQSNRNRKGLVDDCHIEGFVPDGLP